MCPHVIARSPASAGRRGNLIETTEKSRLLRFARNDQKSFFQWSLKKISQIILDKLGGVQVKLHPIM